jgi:hypothetical protein
MSERSSLRGSRLGATSYEDERGVEFAGRQQVAYDCPHGHRFEMVFADDADVPALWECPRCGAESLRIETDRPEQKPTKPPRTHWDMLLERRKIEDLEALLDERLELLRAGALPGGAHLADLDRINQRKQTA